MLIIGLGNLHGGDDAAGILVARGLAERGIESIQHEGPPINLIDIWEGRDRVILIDACCSGTSVGTVHIWDASIANPPAADSSPNVLRSSTHAFGVAETIRLARALGRLPERLTIYGIEGAHFLPGAPPSPAVLEAVERVINEIASSFRPTS